MSGFDGFDFYCMGKYILGLFCSFFTLLLFLLYGQIYTESLLLFFLFFILFYFIIIIFLLYYYFYCMGKYILGLFCSHTRSLLPLYKVSFALILGLFCPYTRSLLPYNRSLLPYDRSLLTLPHTTGMLVLVGRHDLVPGPGFRIYV